ncbi:amp dependent CoA ligase [Trametopsis cervina]|nr:amp dependent CoA ligase [Trametopsis cervina]
MVYFSSRFPKPPPVPNANIHELMFNVPTPSVPDYTLHVDVITGRKRTFYEFKEVIRDGATALASPISDGGLGLSAHNNDIVGIYSHNCMDYIALVHSLLVLTTPFALYSAYGTVFELTNLMRTCMPTKLFVQPSLLSNALAAAKEIGFPEERIYILEGKADGRWSFQDFVDHARARAIPRVPIRPASKSTLAYLVFSSGTTGLPKGVMISHGNIWALMYANIIQKDEEDKFLQPAPPKAPPVHLMFLPFYHTYGLHISCFRVFVQPVTNVIVPKWDVELVLRAIPKYRVNIIALIPSAIHQLVHHPMARKIDWSTIVNVNSGAAYLPPALQALFMKYAKNLPVMTEGYGMSEQTLSAIKKPYPGTLGGIRPPPGCTGILIAGMEGRIMRADGTDADYDEPGELWVRGENISSGYWKNEKVTKETFVNGWLHTGDHFRADKDGFFYFADRAKDTLKVSGAQVSPSEVEDALLSQPDGLITDVCVAGVSGGRTSDEKIPRAWVVLSETGQTRGTNESIDILDQWAKKTLSRYKWLRGGYEVVDAIPKSPTGKVLRRILQEQYEQRHAAQPKL